MSQTSWSMMQREAIDARSGPILVSAGAGSGKTSVLVERVLTRVLDEGLDLDRLLIVTFTEAAALEMKERIKHAILARIAQGDTSARLRQNLALLPQATISTLHSFCMNVIRRGVLDLPIDPGVSVLEPAAAAILSHQALDEVLASAYQEDDPDFWAFVDAYGDDRSERSVRDVILSIHQFAKSQPHPAAWLTQVAQHLQQDALCSTLRDVHFIGAYQKMLLQRLDEVLIHYQRIASELSFTNGPDAYRQYFEERIQRVHAVKQRVLSIAWDGTEGDGLSRFPSVKDADAIKERVNEMRKQPDDRFKEVLKELKTKPAVYLEELRAAAPLLARAVALVLSFEKVYQEKKRMRGVVDFSDLEHFAHQALRDEMDGPTALARAFQEQFAEIIVDEYQDTSPIQDAVLTAVARTGEANVFQVGDVKQSIYRFRMAEPMLFLQKMQRTDQDGGKRILLTENFRSRDSVIVAVNGLFSMIMTREFGGLSYREEGVMKPAAEYKSDPDALSAPVQLLVINRASHQDEHDEEDDHEASPEMRDDDSDVLAGQAEEEEEVEASETEREAQAIAQHIRALFQAGKKVYRKALSEYTPLAYSDIAILLRAARNQATVISEVLRNYGIPCVSDQGPSFYEGVEIRIAIALLQMIDNPRQDIPLAAVLRSRIFSFSTTDLAEIRAGKRGCFFDALVEHGKLESPLKRRIASFFETLDTWRTEIRLMSPGEAVSYLLGASRWLSLCSVMERGAERVARLETLLHQAQAFDETHGGDFADFVSYVVAQHEQSQEDAPARALETQDAVQIMTIHKSKGLEFPVVFVARLGQRFRLTSKHAGIAFHRELGLGPRFVDQERRARADTLLARVIQEEERVAMLTEELRVLYVAMTRAREQLFLVGTVNDLEVAQNVWSDKARAEAPGDALSYSDLTRARTMLDWIAPVALKMQAYRDVPIVWVPYRKEDVEAPDGPVGAVGEVHLSVSPHGVKRVAHASLVDYAQRTKSAVLPAKVSVTEWKRAWDDEDAVRAPERLPSLATLRLSRQRNTPSRESGLARGTFVHAIFQQVDLTLPLHMPEVLRDEVSRLRAAGWVDPLSDEDIPYDELVSFFQSELGQRILRHPEQVRREVSFLMSIEQDAVRYREGVDDPVERLLALPDDRMKNARGGTGFVMMQGTVDAILLEGGQVSIIDYKTDRGNEDLATLVARYTRQVSAYAIALERAWKRPVAQGWLYFTARKEAVCVWPAQTNP
ncbi:helicase-exonuclease AddAB subunit AddA [Ferroacidibacillus organovorans]|uniref:DNA 3'-5' helicase n=1 Tax=Ferroacidibacillus organovorans TaxID=1765683 RepID=A0A101XRN4_9BACL|nr:helicase-exonuclease AddAB subunit AddA [Ferroacidibacillus organovorans]KUO96296.1 hypothetical protein ATW55_03550 [Ferroacidibacillus organovorans]